jgi:hypothetical protein
MRAVRTRSGIVLCALLVSLLVIIGALIPCAKKDFPYLVNGLSERFERDALVFSSARVAPNLPAKLAIGIRDEDQIG